MKLNTPSTEFKALVSAVKEIEARFISPHLAPPTLTVPSRAEVLDVAAYIILVHGIFEDFAEGLALWTLERSVANWTNKKKISRATASLLLFESISYDDAVIESVFDNVRKTLNQAKTRMSKAIFANHGVAVKNLRELFTPLGVDVPSDSVLCGSLELMVTMRHQWAHQDRRFAKVVKSAKDAKTTVSDCIAFAQKLTAQVVTMRP